MSLDPLEETWQGRPRYRACGPCACCHSCIWDEKLGFCLYGSPTGYIEAATGRLVDKDDRPLSTPTRG